MFEPSADFHLERDGARLLTVSGRVFLGEVEVTASDVLEEPRRGPGYEEGLVLSNERFSCL